MIETLRKVLEAALERLHYHVTTYLPSLLAALTLVLAAYLMAALARWVIYRIFKGLTIDKFLRQSGIAFMVDSSGRLRATRLVAETVYWCILLSGVLVGVNVFGTDLTTQITQSFIFLLPKLVAAGLILLAGVWLGQYLGRSMLVWAVNEGFPSPRRLAAVVGPSFRRRRCRRRPLPLPELCSSPFIIFIGAVLAANLAIGLGRGGVQRARKRKGTDRRIW